MSLKVGIVFEIVSSVEFIGVPYSKPSKGVASTIITSPTIKLSEVNVELV